MLTFADPDMAQNAEKVLEEFDFDAFLQNTMENSSAPVFDFSFDRLPMLEVTNEPNQTSLGGSIASESSPGAFTRELCKTLATTYMKAIITVHQSCKRVPGLSYPQILQNQLLTTSRTLNRLGSQFEEKYSIVSETACLEVLQSTMTECSSVCHDFCSAIPTVERLSSNVTLLNSWKEYVQTYEKLLHRTMEPLLSLLRAFNWYAFAP
jgi:hypothetical protein